jgi:hypothetical protein
MQPEDPDTLAKHLAEGQSHRLPVVRSGLGHEHHLGQRFIDGRS